MVVFDNDRVLTVTLPENVWEGGGTLAGAGIATIGGTLTVDLIVNLSCDNTSDIQIPSTITIPAGQTSAAFDIIVLDDGDSDGAESATVTVVAAGFANATDTASIHDDEFDHFSWDAITGPRQASVAFTVNIEARNVDNEMIPAYDATATITGRGDAGAVPVTPDGCAFTGGAWAGSLAIGAVDRGVVLTADDGAGHVGVSNAFDVTSGPLDHFQWGEITSPQYKDIPF